MLVLSRKMNESVIIDGGIRVMVVGVRGNQVRLGFEAPSGVRIFREELCAIEQAHRRRQNSAGLSGCLRHLLRTATLLKPDSAFDTGDDRHQGLTPHRSAPR